MATLFASTSLGSGLLEHLCEVMVGERRWGSSILGKRAGKWRKMHGIPVLGSREGIPKKEEGSDRNLTIV